MGTFTPFICLIKYENTLKRGIVVQMNIFTEDSDNKMDFNIIRKKNLKNLKPLFQATSIFLSFSRSISKMIEKSTLFIKLDKVPNCLV